MVDWWSMGVMLYNLATGIMPFQTSRSKTAQKLTPQEHYQAILKPIIYPEYLSPDLIDLISQFLTVDEFKRLGYGVDGLNDIQDHPYFSRISWKAVASRRVQPPFVPSLAVNESHFHLKPKYSDFHHVVTAFLTADENISELTAQQQLYFQNWYIRVFIDFFLTPICHQYLGTTYLPPHSGSSSD